MNLTEITQQKFDEWIKKWGATYNQEDIDAFNEFAYFYIKDSENYITEKEFVKIVKQHTHTSIHTNRGIAQKFYKRLEAIVSFYKSNNKKHIYF